MSEQNRATIAAYDAHVEEYIANTPSEPSRTTREWLIKSLEGLPISAQILEIGSGFGHDARYIEEIGFVVERSDATPSFVRLLQSQGFQARHFNVLTDEMDGIYDLVLANAVLHHFSKDETLVAATKVLNALTAMGRFAVSSRLGLQEGWLNEKLGTPRYFSHWEDGDIEQLLQDAGYGKVITTDKDKQHGWTHIIASR